MITGILVLMSILAIGFLGTRIASQLRVPHSVFLVVLGVTAGMLIRGHAGTTGSYVQELTGLFPELVLFVLLPPLIFEAAYTLDYAQLREELVPIGALSVVALVLSTLLVGWGLHWAFGLALLPCLVFGSLISATDPVAIVALFREVGAPRRLNTLVEGESLLNDGTALVLFRVLLAATAGSQFGAGLVAHGVVEFFRVALGGAALGLVVAGVTGGLLRLTSRWGSSQIGTTVVAAYASFLIADHFLGVSGVIATLVVGLYLGRRARLELSRDTLDGMRHIWEFLALSANILVFVAVGLAVDSRLILENIGMIPITVGVVYVARAASVFVTIPVFNALRVARSISLAYQAVLFWGGLRGGLALGLVLLLPDTFPHKQRFVALAIAVVISTLLINALTARRILRILKLDRLDAADEGFFRRALQLVRDSAFGRLQEAAAGGGLSAALVEEQRAHLSLVLSDGGRNGSPERDDTGIRFGVSALLLNERRQYDLRVQDGTVSRAAYFELVQLVSRRLELFDLAGLPALGAFRFEVGSGDSLFMRLWNWSGAKRRPAMLRRLTIRLEVLLHLRSTLEELARGAAPAEVAALASEWLKAANEQLQIFYRTYPHYGTAVQTVFMANMIDTRSRKVLQELFEASIISGAVRAKAEERVGAAHHRAMAEASDLMSPTRDYLLGRIPLFGELPKVAIGRIAESARVLVVEAGGTVVREGEEGHSFFVVAAGLLEVRTARMEAAGRRPRLFTGDFFGEQSLLFHRPRSATVVAVMTSELLEIDRQTFEFIIREYPTLRERMYATAESRSDPARVRATG